MKSKKLTCWITITYLAILWIAPNVLADEKGSLSGLQLKVEVAEGIVNYCSTSQNNCPDGSVPVRTAVALLKLINTTPYPIFYDIDQQLPPSVCADFGDTQPPPWPMPSPCFPISTTADSDLHMVQPFSSRIIAGSTPYPIAHFDDLFLKLGGLWTIHASVIFNKISNEMVTMTGVIMDDYTIFSITPTQAWNIGTAQNVDQIRQTLNNVNSNVASTQNKVNEVKTGVVNVQRGIGDLKGGITVVNSQIAASTYTLNSHLTAQDQTLAGIRQTVGQILLWIQKNILQAGYAVKVPA